VVVEEVLVEDVVSDDAELPVHRWLHYVQGGRKGDSPAKQRQSIWGVLMVWVNTAGSSHGDLITSWAGYGDLGRADRPRSLRPGNLLQVDCVRASVGTGGIIAYLIHALER
jgi:hypothetical protein